MKQTIEIEVPDGKIAVWEDGKVVFKSAKPLPKTWDIKQWAYIEDLLPKCPEIPSHRQLKGGGQ